MIKDPQNKLTRQGTTYTTSEQKIAAYLLHHLSSIRFETAASRGPRVGVSAMTVGHLLRTLGYAGLNVLKKVLRRDAPLVAVVQESRAPSRSGLCGALLAD